jgi:diaminopropionate ammonia-lyase
VSAVSAFAGVELFLNPALDERADYPEVCRAVLNREGYRAAFQRISAWPGYRPTELVVLPGLARSCGVASVRYKDESSRFGLGSFKALGGAYAVSRVLEAEARRRSGRDHIGLETLLAGQIAELRDLTVTCATDGNHGRSVAWAAQMFGCRCVIYVHATVSEGRKRAIEAYGATVIRSGGNYDQSVRQAQADAQQNGWLLISDASHEDYEEVPRYVMQGYAVMAQEALDAMSAPPTHLFLQAGVGGMAAAVAAHLWEKLGERRPRVVICEPDRAACLYASARAGAPVAVPGSLDTIMAGLACGEVSALAWTVLAPAAAAFMTLPDELARVSMRLLAAGIDGDPPLVAGESAVAGFAGLLAVAGRREWRAALGLEPDSRVLLFGTEGDTDPALYREIVGWSAEEVRKRVPT